MIFAIYIGLALWQLAWLVLAIRRKNGWGRLLILALASMALAFGCMWYYDTLPGYGIMPGWAYFAEVFYSLVAGIGYFLMMLIAALGLLLRKNRK